MYIGRRIFLRGKTWWIQSGGGKRISTGCRDEMLARIWAAGYDRREMVVEMLQTDPLLRESIEAYIDATRQARNEGMLYAARSGDLVKLGFTSRSPEKRIQQLQTAQGLPLELVALRKGTRDDERRLHEAMRRARVRGEWFDARDPLVAFWLEKHQWRKNGSLAIG